MDTHVVKYPPRPKVNPITIALLPLAINNPHSETYRIVSYSLDMDIDWIIREIDAEIDRLRLIRDFIENLSDTLEVEPRTPRKASSMKTNKKTTPRLMEPPVIVLPPKEKRTYTPRRKPSVESPRALASAIPDRPVFVSKSSPVAAPSVKIETPPVDTKELEAAVRRSLFGQTA